MGLRTEADSQGVTIWKDNKWIIDGSTFLQGGHICIDIKQFNVSIDTEEGEITLTLKEDTL